MTLNQLRAAATIGAIVHYTPDLMDAIKYGSTPIPCRLVVNGLRHVIAIPVDPEWGFNVYVGSDTTGRSFR